LACRDTRAESLVGFGEGAHPEAIDKRLAAGKFCTLWQVDEESADADCLHFVSHMSHLPAVSDASYRPGSKE
jgi:hypothetical protein